MRIGAAGKAAQARLDAGRTAHGVLIVVFLCISAACGGTVIRELPQKVTVATGEPTIGAPAGSVQTRGNPNPGDYTETNPFQIDNFNQQVTAKVDVLWMIDNSASMQPKQDKVKADFQSFITNLTMPGSNAEVVDYHIGVITSDTYDPSQSGKLQNLAHLSKPWIGNMDTCQPPCDPVSTFATMASVGTAGNGDSKHLLALTEALTAPLSTTAPPNGNLGFVRDDASLALIVVTDEDDPSCAPLEYNGTTNFVTSCLESAIAGAPGGWGSVDYYVRLFRELKGFGNEQLVTFSPFVGTTTTAAVPDSHGQQGCLMQGAGVDASNPFSYATYATRHIAVANGVAGLAANYPPDTMGSPAHSICSSDFSAANATIAGYATLNNRFYLSRQPASPTAVKGCVDGTCAPGAGGFCTVGDVAPTTAGCNYSTTTNSVAFNPVPSAGAMIQISYKVHAN